jgi:putative transposase
MARARRVDYPGAWHHVMNRGLRRGAIFSEDADCAAFLEVLGETVEQFGIEVHAYALMTNHFHLLVRTPNANLSDAIGHLTGVYTQRVNRARGWDGPAFRGRFRSEPVEDDDYLNHLVAYLHLNPVEARLARRPDEECWTSHRAHVGLDRPPAWLSMAEVRRRFGSAKGLQDLVRALHQGSKEWPEDFERTVDLFGERPEKTREWLQPPEPPQQRAGAGRTHEDVLAHIAQITGVTREALLETRRGRGANPARRFAVLALGTLPNLRAADIAELMGMTAVQVRHVLQRYRAAPPAPLDVWMAELLARKMENG